MAQTAMTQRRIQGARGTIFQASTLNAIMLGNFDGAVSVAELLGHGAWGLGTYEGLDGEAIICDGRAYNARANGEVVEYGPEERLAFATVASLSARAGQFELEPTDDLVSTKAALERVRRAYEPNDNAWFLTVIEGDVPRVRVRSCEKIADKPYPTLSEAACGQREHLYAGERGRLVGIWAPAWQQGINLPGWHLHFLSQGLRRGGHVLDVALAAGATARIESYGRFELVLPDNPEFATLDLARDLAAETAAVEG